MPTLTPHDSGAEAAAAVTPDPPTQARQSSKRTRRLTEYIQAHTGEDIEVVLTPYVRTACVLPADVDRLIDADATDFDSEAARQVVDAVDGDYLVLISTRPADLSSLPLADQLTADRAQQFGLSLHELGHIRYTNIGTIADRLEDRVEDEYRELVHGLLNYCEDVAIEHQLREAQSQLAADRLELVNRSLTQSASDIGPHEQITFTYRDAIEAYLYDHGIYDSGKSTALQDPDDPRVTFASPDGAKAFEQTKDALDELLVTVLNEPDSVARADAVIDCWQDTIKPLLEQTDEDDHSPASGDDTSAGASSNSPPTPTPSEETESSDVSSECDAPDATSTPQDDTSPDTDAEGPDPSATESEGEEISSDPSTGERSEESSGDDASPADIDGSDSRDQEPDDHSGPSSDSEIAADEPPADFDSENISLEQTQDANSADVLAYPDIGTADSADQLAPEDTQSSETPPASDEASVGESDESEVEDTEKSEADDLNEAETDDVGDSEVSDSSNSTTDTPDGSLEPSTSEPEVGSEVPSDDGTASGKDAEPTPGDESASGDGDSASSDDVDEVDDDVERGDRNDANDDVGVDDDGGEAAPTTANQPSAGQSSLTEFLDGSRAGAADADDIDDPEPDEEENTAADQANTPVDDDSTGLAGEGETTDSREDTGEPASGGELSSPEADVGAEDVDTDTSQDASTSGDIGVESESDGDSPDNDDTDPGSEHDRNEESDATADAAPDESSQVSRPADPAHTDSLDETSEALDADRDAAHDEAETATPDEGALAQDLEETAAALEELADSRESDEDDSTDRDTQDGGGAGSGNLDSLSILPDFGDLASPARWREATAGSEAVAGTLRMVLRESRRDQTRSGVTSGSFDRRRAGALARGDVNAFAVRQQGDDKQYDLVLVLDRSRSMRGFISTAEDAVARFSLACEDLGINVAIMDFVNNDARLVKPFSVETDHVQAGLMSEETGGGTPLADALGLARSLLEQRRDSPLIIIITDGKPGDPDAYQTELRQCTAPVCGLTLALDTPRGQAPARAQDVEQFYDRHLYVHDVSQLDARLDQFTVMFDGL